MSWSLSIVLSCIVRVAASELIAIDCSEDEEEEEKKQESKGNA